MIGGNIAAHAKVALCVLATCGAANYPSVGGPRSAFTFHAAEDCSSILLAVTVTNGHYHDEHEHRLMRAIILEGGHTSWNRTSGLLGSASRA